MEGNLRRSIMASDIAMRAHVARPAHPLRRRDMSSNPAVGFYWPPLRPGHGKMDFDIRLRNTDSNIAMNRYRRGQGSWSTTRNVRSTGGACRPFRRGQRRAACLAMDQSGCAARARSCADPAGGRRLADDRSRQSRLGCKGQGAGIPKPLAGVAGLRSGTSATSLCGPGVRTRCRSGALPGQWRSPIAKGRVNCASWLPVQSS